MSQDCRHDQKQVWAEDIGCFSFSLLKLVTSDSQLILDHMHDQTWLVNVVGKYFVIKLLNDAEKYDILQYAIRNQHFLNLFQLIPINIIELVTKSTLYWNNGLKSMAPLECARSAQFKMIRVSDSSDGLIVKFQSLVQMPIPKAFLSVNYQPQNTPPKFLLLPVSHMQSSSIPDAMGPKTFLLIRKVPSVQELIDTKKVCLSIFKHPGYITSGVGNSQCSTILFLDPY